MSDRARGVYCNRTLNLHAIKAIGYDMDYTLIHYHVQEWERLAYAYLKEGLVGVGWPVEALEFDPQLVTRGLIIDLELGNIVKANRFGYVKRAMHGLDTLAYDDQRRLYARTRIDLREPRWRFMNTLFSISEACMYAQLVEMCDQGALPKGIGYAEIYRTGRKVLDVAHMEGLLKGEILAAPDLFVDLDPDMPLTLLDQKEAGKKVVLITNSEWSYAKPMLDYAFDRFLPGDMTWSDLFDVSIVGARKPSFFEVRSPAFEVVDDDGTLREARGLMKSGHRYVGGNASLIEESLGLRGEEILYVGDHLFVDVNVSKSIYRWRTALVVRELESEIESVESYGDKQTKLDALMLDKEVLEGRLSQARLKLQHVANGHAEGDAKELSAQVRAVRGEMSALDSRIAPLARAYGALASKRWGLLMRAGNDKSHLARQVERYADVYTSRVANFRAYTPFAYLRSARGSLPHG